MKVSTILLQNWLTVTLTCFALLYNSASDAQNVTGQIHLISTIGGNPSLSPLVTWNVYRVETRNHNSYTTPIPIYTVNRHSVSLTLAPGNYKAVVKLADKVREQTFKIQAEDKHIMEVPLDRMEIPINLH